MLLRTKSKLPFLAARSVSENISERDISVKSTDIPVRRSNFGAMRWSAVLDSLLDSKMRNLVFSQ